MNLAPVEFLQAPPRHWTQAEAEAYTRWLATNHYENFQVVSFLLPKKLHQDFYNVYAYCRWADDLGDEIGNTAESTRLLKWWDESLRRMYEGEAEHPVFVALRGTVTRHGIPQEPFTDLLHAFLQDQTITRYQNWSDLEQYCRYSANPVGRLVLYLCGYSDEARQQLSDATCTGLQLANFWQDVAVDLEKDRVYLPLELLAKHGYSLDELFQRRVTTAFREVMKEAVGRARSFFIQGLPLAQTVNRRLALDLELFSNGGLCILDKIRKQNYDVLSRRPKISKAERVGVLLGTMLSIVSRMVWKPAA